MTLNFGEAFWHMTGSEEMSYIFAQLLFYLSFIDSNILLLCALFPGFVLY